MSLLDVALIVVAGILLLCILAGVWRALRGPTTEDRLTSFVLLGTSGAALFIILATLTGMSALRDAAIIIVALATVVVVVYTRKPTR